MDRNRTDSKENKSNAPDGTFKITGNWMAQSELLKDKFPQLTDKDLHFTSGQEDDLLVRMEAKLNKKRPEIINIIRKGSTEKA